MQGKALARSSLRPRENGCEDGTRTKTLTVTLACKNNPAIRLLWLWSQCLSLAHRLHPSLVGVRSWWRLTMAGRCVLGLAQSSFVLSLSLSLSLSVLMCLHSHTYASAMLCFGMV